MTAHTDEAFTQHPLTVAEHLRLDHGFTPDDLREQSMPGSPGMAAAHERAHASDGPAVIVRCRKFHVRIVGPGDVGPNTVPVCTLCRRAMSPVGAFVSDAHRRTMNLVR